MNPWVSDSIPVRSLPQESDDGHYLIKMERYRSYLGYPSTFVNYFGQLRMYSAVDFVLLLIMLNVRPIGMASVLTLWFGFLIFLEWLHRDSGRALWPAWAWLVCLVFGIWIYPHPCQMAVCATAFGYALKKIKWMGIFSPALIGLLKVFLVFPFSQSSLQVLLVVWFAMAVRNLCGDIRDAGKDFMNGQQTIPVAMGYRRNTKYVYPLALATTSFVWAVWGHLPIWSLGLAWTIQIATYRLTPR